MSKIVRACFLCLVYAIAVEALPQGAIVEQGTVDSLAFSENLQITATDRSVIQWDQFSIGETESVQFIQPSVDAVVLNRVNGQEVSEVYGSLLSNGKVYLLNPSGILIGKDALIDTGSFVASTLFLSTDEFLAGGDLLFQGDSSAKVVNLGTIRSSGDIFIFAQNIENSGSMIAPNGSISLLAGREIFLNPEETPILRITPEIETASVELDGSLQALAVQIESNSVHSLAIRQTPKGSMELVKEGGKIVLRTKNAVLYNEGTIVAPNGEISIDCEMLCQLGTIDVTGSSGGRINIHAQKCLQDGKLLADGSAENGGTISIDCQSTFIETAKALTSLDGKTKGGTFSLTSDGSLFTSGTYRAQGDLGGSFALTGEHVALAAATVDASGISQGGEICIGGGFQGQDSSIANTKTVLINGAAKLNANASAGSGGRVIVWSDEKTEHRGSIEASGKNGFIEVSCKDLLVCSGKTFAEEILFDPNNIVIDETAGYPQYEFIDPNAGQGYLYGKQTLGLSTGNVVITKDGDNFYSVSSGAVYLFNGVTGALISTLTGFSYNDQVGYSVAALKDNGNFVVLSHNWNLPSGASRVGAATLVNGVTGLTGIVSASNSLIGSNTNDFVGSNGILPLTNGNYVVLSPSWEVEALFLGKALQPLETVRPASWGQSAATIVWWEL